MHTPGSKTTPTLLLDQIGRRVRARRKALDLTGQQLADKSGLSRRFIAQIEAGQGNVAVGRLASLADALQVPLPDLVAPPGSRGPRRAMERLLHGRSDDELASLLPLLEAALGVHPPRILALIGLRGAGKSTVGPLVAERLELGFVELDDRIEDAAGLNLGEIFALHGEAWYRRLETLCVAELVAERTPCVVALPGGIVGNEEALALVRHTCLRVWLRAAPEEHMRRVLAQGDHRPIVDRADAMAELRSLLKARDPLYGQADLTVLTSGRTVDEVVDDVTAAAQATGL